MNVLKILVDELPESCRDCCFSRFRTIRVDVPFLWRCVAMDDRFIQGKERPEWCPLVVDVPEVCEWKECWEYTSKFDNEGFWHIDTKCNWIYPEDYDVNISELILDNVKDFIKLMGFTFCPNCGKRIKYVESEE